MYNALKKMLTVVLAVSVAFGAMAQDKVVRTVLDLGRTDNRTMQHDDYLSYRIGGRLVGSPALTHAEAWVKEQFESWGLEVIVQEAGKINVGILWCNIVWLFVMSFIPFTTAWVGTYPNSWAPLSLYFADMTLACISSHLIIYLIARENGLPFRLGTRSIVSLVTYFGATVLGGFCPIAAFIAVAAVSCWWMVPEKTEED